MPEETVLQAPWLVCTKCREVTPLRWPKRQITPSSKWLKSFQKTLFTKNHWTLPWPLPQVWKTLSTHCLKPLSLVILVVFIFLQNWRATLIPLITVPVSLIGTIAVFPMLGFSINTLSLLGLVLAIGIVVDDAIVVVEAVIHHIEDREKHQKKRPYKPCAKCRPVIAIALILCAVFIPVAMTPGITGTFLPTICHNHCGLGGVLGI